MSEITPETLFSDDVLWKLRLIAGDPTIDGPEARCVAMRAVLWAQVQPVITRLAQERDVAEAKLAHESRYRKAAVARQVELERGRDAARQDVARLQRVIEWARAAFDVRRLDAKDRQDVLAELERLLALRATVAEGKE